MSNRAWWPAFMADEMMPISEVSPTAWVREALGDKWLIAERVEDRSDEESTRREISPGETMDFLFCDYRPPALVRFNADGSYSIVGGTDAGANSFVLEHEWDCMGDSLAELAKEVADLEEPGLHTVICRYWSNEIPHRFEIGEDGPRFVALSAVPTPHSDPDLFDKAGGD